MDSQEQLITRYIETCIQTKTEVRESQILCIARVAEVLKTACKNGNTIFWFGNGGSAADAQHLACELVSRFFRERKALSSIALTTNTSELTAIANDYDFTQIFSRQIEALAKTGDVAIGISTSGNSANVIEAFRKARERGVVTVAFTGRTGGQMRDEVEYLITVPSDITPHIQESHIMIGHILCYLVEKEMFGS